MEVAFDNNYVRFGSLSPETGLTLGLPHASRRCLRMRGVLSHPSPYYPSSISPLSSYTRPALPLTVMCWLFLHLELTGCGPAGAQTGEGPEDKIFVCSLVLFVFIFIQRLLRKRSHTVYKNICNSGKRNKITNK